MPTAIRLPGGAFEMVPSKNEIDQEFVTKSFFDVIKTLIEEIYNLQLQVAVLSKKAGVVYDLEQNTLLDRAWSIGEHNTRRDEILQRIESLRKRVG